MGNCCSADATKITTYSKPVDDAANKGSKPIDKKDEASLRAAKEALDAWSAEQESGSGGTTPRSVGSLSDGGSEGVNDNSARTGDGPRDLGDEVGSTPELRNGNGRKGRSESRLTRENVNQLGQRLIPVAGNL